MSDVKLVARNDYVLIRPDKEKEKTESGLLTAENKKSRPERGVVVSVGSSVDKKNSLPNRNITPGMRVVFCQFPQEEIEENGEKLLLIKDEYIIAIEIETVEGENVG